MEEEEGAGDGSRGIVKEGTLGSSSNQNGPRRSGPALLLRTWWRGDIITERGDAELVQKLPWGHSSLRPPEADGVKNLNSMRFLLQGDSRLMLRMTVLGQVQ